MHRMNDLQTTGVHYDTADRHARHQKDRQDSNDFPPVEIHMMPSYQAEKDRQ